MSIEKFNKTEQLVEQTLREYPATQKDDYSLIFGVYVLINPKVRTMSFKEIARNYKALGLPMPATITRCRQIVQNRYPELKDKETAKIREAVEQEDYKEYNRNSK